VKNRVSLSAAGIFWKKNPNPKKPQPPNKHCPPQPPTKKTQPFGEAEVMETKVTFIH